MTRASALLADDGRLDRILAGLPPADAAYLSSLVEPPWRQRARRLAQRDDAIRRALAMLPDEPNPAARLAVLMAEQVGTCWGRTGNHLVIAALRSALELNGNAAMTERHIRNVAAGDRTPRK